MQYRLLNVDIDSKDGLKTTSMETPPIENDVETMLFGECCSVGCFIFGFDVEFSKTLFKCPKNCITAAFRIFG